MCQTGLVLRPERRARSSHWLTFLGIGVAGSLLVAGALAALSARYDAWQLAEQQARNLRLTLQRDIDRNITVFDLSLKGVIEALGERGIETASPGIRRHALFDRAAGAEDLGSIVVAGPDGTILESSTSRLTGDTIAGRPEFEIHRSTNAATPYVSRASQMTFDSDRPGISISRRISSGSGAFAGVVSGVLNLSYFERLFDHIDIGPKGVILLVRTDGHIIWRYPSPKGDVDRDLSLSPSFQQLNAAQNGQFVGKSTVDGMMRLYSFGHVGSLPLIVSVNMAVDDIFARWREKAAIIGPMIVIICASVVMLSILFHREMLRRTTAERALEEAANSLARMAATDALTGLANRRSFEVDFEREWACAVAERSQISVLMIDADHFKRFNDFYGHQAGDCALKQIADGISRCLRNPADLAARFGGEEFVVLLPDCGARGAKTIAERIVETVAQLAIPHLASDKQIMTVSAGVSTTSPVQGDQAADFLREADANLYEAKRCGRNAVRAADAEGVVRQFSDARSVKHAS